MREQNLSENDAFALTTNRAGDGAIDGIGIGPKGAPGVPPKKKKLRTLFPILKRKTDLGNK